MRHVVLLTALTLSSPCFASLTLDCTADDDALAFDLQMSIGDTPGRPLGGIHGGSLTLKRGDLPARLQPVPLEAGDIKSHRLAYGRIDLMFVRTLDPDLAIAFRIRTRDVDHDETNSIGAYELRLIERRDARHGDRVRSVVTGTAACTLGP